MIIKKFVGKTEEEAVQAAKKELGSGAVIMNVRTVPRKGLRALFRPKDTEVTAALEEEGDMARAVRRDTAAYRPAKPSSAGEAGEAAAEGRSKLSGTDGLAIEKKLDTLQSLLVNRFQQNEDEQRDASAEKESAEPEEEEGEEKLQELTEQQRFVRLLYNTMLKSEVDEKYANQIVEDIDVTGQSNLPLDRILVDVYQKMILKFGRAEGITPAGNGPKIVVFMGPTGVGKTTTIAKIAGSFTMEEKKKIAFLTADTYRIAAVEQLRTYAGILELPFRVVYSAEEAKEAVGEFADFDYIFVDTAGHSHRNGEQVGNVKGLFESLREVGECQAFLVLSSTTKYSDLLKIVSSYGEIPNFQLIFTKLDETVSMGNLLNLKLFAGMPIAFVTNGQNVPDDIERFNPQKTVKRILSTKQEGDA